YENLSHDMQIVNTYRHDPLRHEKISPNLYLGMLENFESAFKNADKIKIPLLMQLAGDDRVVSRPAAERFFDMVASPIKEINIYVLPHFMKDFTMFFRSKRSFKTLLSWKPNWRANGPTLNGLPLNIRRNETRPCKKCPHKQRFS